MSLPCRIFAPESDRILNYFDSYIYGYTLIELQFPIQTEDYVHTTEQMLPDLSKKDYPVMHQLSLLLLQGDYDGKQSFTFGIQTILKGLEMKLNNEGEKSND